MLIGAPCKRSAAPVKAPTEKKSALMNVLLWVIQIALALLYMAGGAYKVFSFGRSIR
jgi:hypothetical protein